MDQGSYIIFLTIIYFYDKIHRISRSKLYTEVEKVDEHENKIVCQARQYEIQLNNP